MASELQPWRFELEIFPSRLPVDMYLSPNWMLSRVQSVKHFFGNALSRAHRGVLVPTSSSSIAICHFWLHLKPKTKFKEKHGKKTPLSTFHCNQLQHTRSACFKTDLPDHFRFNFVQVVTEPCGSVVLLWRHGGHVTETRDFQLQTTQMLEASCLFSFKSILLRTSGKCQSIKWTACMLNFIYIVQSKWYLRLKISVQGPFNMVSSRKSGQTLLLGQTHTPSIALRHLLQTLPELVTLLKGHSLSPRSCPPTRSAPSERFGYW